MKRIIALLFVVTFVVACFCSCQEANTPASDSSAGSEPVVKIAHIGGFTGSYAPYAAIEKQCAEMMQDIINENGGIKSLGGAKIEFVYGDHMSDTTQIKTVFERTVADEDVVAVLHNTSSTFSVPMTSYAEKIGIPFMTINSGSAITESGYKYVFQDTAHATEVGTTQVEFLKYLNEEYGVGTDKVGILFMDNDAGRDSADGAKALVDTAGFSIIAEEAYPIGSADMSSQIVSLKDAGAEVVFLFGDLNDLKQVMSTMKSFEYNPLIIGGGGGMALNDFAVALGDNAEGICFVGPSSFDSIHVQNDPELKAIIDEYHERYGYYPSTFELGFLSEVVILVDAIEACGSTDRKVINDTLHEMEYTSMQFGEPRKFEADGSSPNTYFGIQQWQKLDNGELAACGVWPEKFCSTELEFEHATD